MSLDRSRGHQVRSRYGREFRGAGSIRDLLLLTTELRYQWREAESHQELASQVIKREEDDAR